MTAARVRECGDCIVCCVLLRVDSEELQKPSLTHCRHLNLSLPIEKNTWQYTSEEEVKCKIYPDRYPICRAYHCLWRMGYGREEDRPDRCGVLIDRAHNIDNCIEVRPLGPDYQDLPRARAAVGRICCETQCPAIVSNFAERCFVRIVGRPPVEDER